MTGFQGKGGREAFLKARDALSVDALRTKGRQIQERLLDLEEYQRSRAIFIYCSKGSEVQTRPLIDHALKAGKRVALPVCLDEESLEARWIQGLEDCEKGRFGIMEPRDGTSKAEKSQIDCFLIPGTAFDLKGNRMGHGKGYFDRYLADLKPSQVKIGLAYEAQLCPSLEVKSHDVKVDVLVTEDRVIYCGGKQ